MKIIVVRIGGKIDLSPAVARTLEQLGLKKKFSCIIIEDSPESMGMIKRIRDHAAFSPVEAETLKQMLLKRAKTGKKQVKIDEKTVDAFVNEFMQNTADFKKLKINPVFALHPPRGGFKKSSKFLWPRGILGENKDINKLVLKML
jgi:large subunit ribosomal protein L30